MIHVPADQPMGTEPDYLAPGRFIDSANPAISAFAEAAVEGLTDDREKAVRLFYRVRDGWRYDPFGFRLTGEHHTASTVLEAPAGYCITKAVLLAALARAVGIPSAVGFADVTNHFSSEKLTRQMGGSKLFVNHGFTVLRIGDRWVKAAPAFNIELCERFGTAPTEFDGRADAILQEFDSAGRQHMEYIRHHGSWSDLPYDRIEADFRRAYAGSDLIRDADAPESAAPRTADADDPFLRA